MRSAVLARGAVTVTAAPPPAPPSREWGDVTVVRAGICGSDLGRGPAEPPLVPGHEVVGTDAAGRRVLVHPLVRCAARGLRSCPACVAGRYDACDAFWSDDALPKAIGFDGRLPGGWAETVAVHPSMLVPLPDGLPWRAAVLGEPLAVAVSVVRQVRHRRPAVVAVVGGGTIGQLAAVAARSLLPGARVVHVVRHSFQAAASGDAVVAAGDGVAEVAAHLDVRAVPGPSGPLLLDGPDVVVDAVGTPGALGLALRLARRDGLVATAGNPGAGADLHPLWLKRLTLAGHLEYRADPDAPPGEDPDPFREALRLLRARPSLGEALVTHEVPLADAATAVDVARHRRAHHAIKVVLVP